EELYIIRKYLDNYLINRFIRPNSSPIVALILLVKKPGGGIYININYRGLNNIIVKNKYLILLIRKTINTLKKAK
ncbi:hypothetical protein NEUTE1DRAFT_51551, partial [Neurospora tetrasperma FGSC 2508]